MDPEKESCGISFTSKEKNEKIGQVSLCFVVGIISVLSIVPPKKEPELCDQALAVSEN